MKQIYAPEHDSRQDEQDTEHHVVIAPEELGEHLAALTNEQFDQFCQLVIDTNDEALQHMVRNLICAKLIDKRVKEIAE